MAFAPLVVKLPRLLPGQSAPEPPPEEVYSGAIGRALAKAVRQQESHVRQRALVEEHLPAVRAARSRAELAAVGLARIGGWAPVEALLQCSFEVRHSDPGRMVVYAEEALALALRLDPESHGYLAVADLQANVLAELGNAYRVAERLREAEETLQKARDRFRCGSRLPVLKARILDVLASLRAAQRRFASAHALLDRVGRIYVAQGDRHLAGRALIKQGLYANYEQRPDEALDLLTRGRALIDAKRDPKLALSAVHGSVWRLVDVGEHRRARRELFEHRHLYRQDGDTLTLVKLRWLEARIDAGLGRLEQAASTFEGVRSDLAEMGLPYKAALAGLDLAQVMLRQGQTVGVFALVEEMAATFCSMHIGREALAALLVLRSACEREHVSVEIIQTVASFLRTVERDPNARFEAEQPAN